MAKEIERKYVLKELPSGVADKAYSIHQGYVLAYDKEMRVRKKNARCFLTCKSDGDLSREEFETEIPEWVFDMFWKLTDGRRIEKTRYIRFQDGLKFEIDIYYRELQGLIILEVEFPDEESANKFILPVGIEGKDVTLDKRYKNKNLALYGLPK